MSALQMAALVYAAALILMTQGFVLTYKTTRAPNFMLGQLMTMGAMAASASIELIGLPPPMSYPFSFVVGFIMMTAISIGIIEPLLRRKTSPVLITLTTMSLGLIIEGLLRIYHEYIKLIFETYFPRYMLRQYDFRLAGMPGVFIIATFLTLASILLFKYGKRTSIGVASRARMENPELAQVQGMNIYRNRILLWSLAGGMSSLAGGIMVMWFNMTPTSGSWVSTAILASAILGGMDNFRGAFIGGMVIGVSEIMLTSWGQAYIGVWVGEYRAVIPFIVMCLTLLIYPNGLFGSDVEEFRTRSNPLTRIKPKILAAIILWLVLSGALVENISNRNKAEAREAIQEDLSFFDLEERAMNRSISDFEIGNSTTFKNTVERLNITEIYVEPGTLTIYYIRHNAYWTLRIRLRRVGLWNWEPR